MSIVFLVLIFLFYLCDLKQLCLPNTGKRNICTLIKEIDYQTCRHLYSLMCNVTIHFFLIWIKLVI